MKKLSLSLAAVVALALFSCGKNEKPKIEDVKDENPQVESNINQMQTEMSEEEIALGEEMAEEVVEQVAEPKATTTQTTTKSKNTNTKAEETKKSAVDVLSEQAQEVKPVVERKVDNTFHKANETIDKKVVEPVKNEVKKVEQEIKEAVPTKEEITNNKQNMLKNMNE